MLGHKGKGELKFTRQGTNGREKAQTNPSSEANGRFLPSAQVGFPILG